MTLLDIPELKESGKKHEEERISVPSTKSDFKDNDRIMMTRHQFKEAVIKMAEAIKERKVPERVEKFRNREIIIESLKKRGQNIVQNNPKMSIYLTLKRVVLYQ